MSLISGLLAMAAASALSGQAAPVQERPETLARLKNVSTATLATALFKRGLRQQFIQNVQPLRVHGRQSMVGPAYTLRYIPAREDLNGIEVFKDPGHLQRRGIEECPAGHVMVFDSRKDARAATKLRC